MVGEERGLTLISEAIRPAKGTFDPGAMSRGEPGLPEKFTWRKRELIVAEVLETWKDHGDCAHGSGERYLRKHFFRVRTTEGEVLRIYFQRSFGRASVSRTRWWLHSREG